MPNVYTLDDPQRIESQVASIQLCLGLIGARILLLEQELEELSTNGDSFIREYLELYIFPMLNADEETKAVAYEARGKILEEDKYWCNDDINRLKQLKLYLLDMLAGKDDGLLLALQLQINMKGCENGRLVTEELGTRLQHTAEEEYKTILRKNGKNKHAPAVIAAVSHKNKVANRAKFDIKYFEKTTQLYLYEKVLRILKANVFNEIEKDLPKFFMFSIGAGTIINIGFKSTFTELENTNKKLLKDTQAKLVARHLAAIDQFPKHETELAFNLSLFILASGILKTPDLNSQKGIVGFYRNHYTCESNLKAHDTSDSELLEAQLKLLQRQADIANVEAARVALEKAELEAKAVQASEEEKILAEETKFKAIQDEKDKKEQLRLEHVRKIQLRETENDKKAKAKMQRHQDAVKQSEKFTPAENRKEKVLAISEEVVLANAVELRELFTATRYRFSKLGSLARALGGELIEDSRSKHGHLCFNELYEIEAWQGANEDSSKAASASVKGSVSAPHGQGRDSFIYRYNLKLVRRAVENVMPANYLELLKIQPRATTQSFSKSTANVYS